VKRYVEHADGQTEHKVQTSKEAHVVPVATMKCVQQGMHFNGRVEPLKMLHFAKEPLEGLERVEEEKQRSNTYEGCKDMKVKMEL